MDKNVLPHAALLTKIDLEPPHDDRKEADGHRHSSDWRCVSLMLELSQSVVLAEVS